MRRRTNRLPVAFLFVGLLFKTTLVVLFGLWHTALILRLDLLYDPGAWYFAEKIANFFFRREPPPTESVVYEISLVVGFGIECLLIGLMLQCLLRRWPRGNQEQS